MNMGPMASLLGSVAGQSAAQAHGSEAERVGRQTVAQEHQVSGQRRAEAASGVGATEGDGAAPRDRDADGRRLWEDQLDLSGDATPEQPPGENQPDDATAEGAAPAPSFVEPNGMIGGELDITA